jgi:ankyrin repeat protein
MTGLLYAAREGYVDVARAMVGGGANINLESGDGYTPLVLAIANGHLDFAQYLVDSGADPNRAGLNGLTPLYATIDLQWSPKAFVPQPILDQEKVKYLGLMTSLLDHGADVNARIKQRSWFRGYADFKSWVDDAGATAFWRAANALDLSAMRMLVARGADPKNPNKLGDTPLLAAAGIGWGANWNVDAPYNRMDVVKYCVELGNDVHAVDSKGYTALHGAAYLGNNDLVKYLASLGADVNARTKAGDTIADMANGPTRFGMPHPDTVALLERMGSANSNNCRSDQCVVAAKVSGRPRESLDPSLGSADRAALNAFAVAIEMTSAEYHPDEPGAQSEKRGRR